MNIENKRILLVGKETYMYPFYYLIDEWSGKNEIATFWVNPMESQTPYSQGRQSGSAPAAPSAQT